ncbi:hypothetical protein D1Y58_21215 [Escherichia coli]|nr:hypothetical protein [Escherichia coli]EFO0120692.1 hypothetical protein [Escherichia coli]EFO0130920.1 hypothetical protein [Escherichia coli]
MPKFSVDMFWMVLALFLIQVNEHKRNIHHLKNQNEQPELSYHAADKYLKDALLHHASSAPA